MAFRKSTTFLLLTVIFFLKSCYSDSSQNIEVIYAPISPSPSPTPSPSQSPPSDLLPPPAPPPVLTPPSKKTASKKTIAIAVGVTAFCTLLLAAFLFFLTTKYEEDKKKKEAVMVASRDGGDGGGGGGLPPVVVQTRNDGKGKGLMIEEESQSKNGSFHRELIRHFSRGNSSSFMNQNQIHPKDDQELVLLDLNLSASDHVSHNSDSPPPPPPPPVAAYAAPPPPPPPMSTKKGHAPPPPMYGKKGPAPPPPPPKGGGASGLPRPPPLVRVSAIEEDEENVDQVKLKPLHWEKVNVIDKAHSMVWDKLQGGSFQYSVDMMEALFGTVATNRKPPTETSENKSATKIFILDSRRSQNFAIVIKSLGISRSELIDGLLEGKGLNPETLEKLTRLSPTSEEKSQILSFNGDVGRLADAESFLYHLLKAVPSAFTRVNAIHFRYTFDSEIDQLKNMLQTLDLGCNELRERGLFLKLLEAILKSGNKLNAGTTRGNAKAFNLTSLRKLSDYKSSDGKTTLLHFVVNEVVRNEGRRRVLNSNEIESKPKSKDEEEQEFLKLGLPVVSGLSLKLLDVMKSANIDYDTLSNFSTSLETRVNKTRQLVLGIDGEEDEFTKEMKKFLEAAEVEVNAVKEEQIRVMEHVKKTTQYYQSGAYKEKQPLLLFAIVKDFLGMVDKACAEIARSLQQKKGNSEAASSSKSQVSSSADVLLRNRVTFPQMSDSFMSVNSTASDSDAPPSPPPPPPVAAYNAAPPPPMSTKKGPAPHTPPPPAPMSGKKGPAPPPPPPKGGGGSGLPGLPPPVKLKPLHWEKANVVNKAHSMVWDKLQGGSFQYSVDTMESLFGTTGTTATNRKPTETSENKTASNPTAKIFILDSRRSQNFAIVIKSLGISRTDLIDGLLKGKGLNPETLEKLTRLSPTTEEKSQILAFNGDVGRLADAESFLYHLLKSVPSAFTRVNAIHFRYTFDSEINQLKNMLQTLDLGCNELRERGLFLKLLEAILKSGNKLNAGTARGNAKAFNLTSLRKLSDYKSSDGKTTLLHFVVNEVVRNEGRRRVLNSTEIELKSNSKEEEEKEFWKLGLPIVSGLSSKFLNVMKSANIDYDTLSNIGTSLETRVTKTRQLVLGIDGEEDEFTKEMKEFLEAAEVEVNAVKEEQIRVMESVKKTTQYYESGASKEKQPLLLFAIVKDFLGMVDKACAEIARSLQQKKGNSDTASSSKSQVSSSADVSRTKVTFPQMSDSFMSVNSTASNLGDEW